MTVHAVIQARTGSTRLPGKALADLRGRPTLAHVIDRVQRARTVDKVVVATTVAREDDAIVRLCNKAGVLTVRGPVDDVLTRFVIAQRCHPAAMVIRVTADCPLLDWRLVDRVVGVLRRTGADYASNVTPPSYPDGYDVEAMTAVCLERVDELAMRAYEREHVTAHIREHPDEYRIASVRCRRDLSWMRLTVDVPSDLERVNTVLALLPPAPPPRLGAVLALLRRQPELAASPDDPARDAAYHTQRVAALQESSR